MKAWIARDKDGEIWIYIDKPWRSTNSSIWVGKTTVKFFKDTFPQVRWEDKEPTEVELTIKIKED